MKTAYGIGWPRRICVSRVPGLPPPPEKNPNKWLYNQDANQSTESTDLDSMNIDIGLCCKWTRQWPVQARIAATELTQLQQ